MPRFDIDFINENAESIDPESNKVKTSSGKVIEYDYLVIATGPKLVFGAEGQEQYSTSVCTAEHAMELNKKLEEFYRNPGPVVVGAIPGVSCFGPAYEFAFIEPYIGHLGLAGVGTSRRIMEDLFAERSIKYIANVKIKSDIRRSPRKQI